MDQWINGDTTLYQIDSPGYHRDNPLAQAGRLRDQPAGTPAFRGPRNRVTAQPRNRAGGRLVPVLLGNPLQRRIDLAAVDPVAADHDA